MIANAPKLPQLIANAKAEGWAEWIRSPADELAVLNGCRFDDQRSLRPVRFFEKFLRHSKGRWAGQPFRLLPWQCLEIIQPLFGWFREDGRLRFSFSYIEIPKKNGKSTLAAGVGLYKLIGEGEGGSMVYSVATTRTQAGLVHGEAINMVKQSPALLKKLKINHATHTIAHPAKFGEYKALATDVGSNEGLNAYALIFDELHAWRNPKVWNELEFACSARDNSLRFVITTAGDDTESVCFQQHEYAKRVQVGEIEDDRVHTFITGATKDDDLELEEVWQRTNPSLGETIRVDQFGDDLKKAKGTSNAAWVSFMRYRFNIWQRTETPWLDHAKWMECGDDFGEADLVGRTCFGGLDLAKVSDLCAFALVFPPEESDPLWRFLVRFWLPEAKAMNPDPRNVYRQWAQAGLIQTTPGEVCDYRIIREEIEGFMEPFDVRAFGYDRAYADEMTAAIEENTGVERIVFRQGMPSFMGPTAEFERLVAGGLMAHPNHPVLNYQATHVNIHTDYNNNKRPVKPKRGDSRTIDGIIASVMGLGVATMELEGVEAITKEDMFFV